MICSMKENSAGNSDRGFGWGRGLPVLSRMGGADPVSTAVMFEPHGISPFLQENATASPCAGVCTSSYLKSVLGDTGPSRPQLHLSIQRYHMTKKDMVKGTAVAPGTAWGCLPSSWPSALSFAIGCCLVLALHTFYSNEPSKKPPSLGLCPLLAGSSGWSPSRDGGLSPVGFCFSGK